MKSLLLSLVLLTTTPTLLSADVGQTMTTTTHTNKKLPITSSLWTTAQSAWQWCVDLFYGLFNKMGMRKIPPMLKKMYATRVDREKTFTARYTKIGIPQEIAEIAGTLDRMEEDFTACRTALKSTDDENLEASLYAEIKRIDDGVDTYMDKKTPVIDTFEEKAFKKRDVQLIKFIQVLQSRSFLEQLLDAPTPQPS